MGMEKSAGARRRGVGARESEGKAVRGQCHGAAGGNHVGSRVPNELQAPDEAFPITQASTARWIF